MFSQLYIDQEYHRQTKKVKGKVFPYSLPSVGPGADPGVQAVSLQVTLSHPPNGRLPLLPAGYLTSQTASPPIGQYGPDAELNKELRPAR